MNIKDAEMLTRTFVMFAIVGTWFLFAVDVASYETVAAFALSMIALYVVGDY